MQSFKFKIYLTGYDMLPGSDSREETVDKMEKSGLCNYSVEFNHRHKFRVGIYVSSWGSGEVLGG